MVAISELPGALDGLGPENLVDPANGQPTCPPRLVSGPGQQAFESGGVPWPQYLWHRRCRCHAEFFACSKPQHTQRPHAPVWSLSLAAALPPLQPTAEELAAQQLQLHLPGPHGGRQPRVFKLG